MRYFLILMVSLAVLPLCGCGTTNGQGSTGYDNAAHHASHSKSVQYKSTPSEALSHLEKAYKVDSANPEKIVAYSVGLREEGYLNRSKIILSPWVEKPSADPRIIAEYAMVNIAFGDYDVAEDYARKALAKDEHNAIAAHALAIVLDVTRRHEQAEPYFRESLANWSGDPVPVMNNLALNLASQGKLDEAMSLLQEAKELAPDRVEVDRNIKIIKTLQDTAARSAPNGVPNILSSPAQGQEQDEEQE